MASNYTLYLFYYKKCKFKTHFETFDFRFSLQQNFKQLTHLDLFNNDVCNSDDYRAKVFQVTMSKLENWSEN